ncbi:hypothetical protein HWB79_gp199 [Streptomyces phage LukeCage]|jgi:hypothetical protein|uniref:Uncharacterized protein n=2 Tax=Karimacvirus TaxID=2843400 RepID=A0A345M8L6_9CAUD|nr:hypothetical protein HWB77_gp200 [Streptomyces phage StarPlatinum]YP_009840012.1 hypothetical protein HWB79_gp199 [Streptomyces phage LukeCage]AXH66837.1 hypothetical protein SEA_STARPLATINUM_89 [Streptomyces phage StarPlatinum]AXH69614.1 hypothetical protein SEA_LUKECAGE_88 [Streptomyces phage LukeCage]
MKLVITVPEQVFEYEIPDYVAERYREMMAEPHEEWEEQDFWDTWTSDTWPETYLEVVDDD